MASLREKTQSGTPREWARDVVAEPFRIETPAGAKRERLALSNAEWSRWVRRAEAEQMIIHRGRLVTALLGGYIGMVIFTGMVTLLQGFHIGDFELDPTSLKWLTGTLMAQLVGLLAIIVRAVFKQGSR